MCVSVSPTATSSAQCSVRRAAVPVLYVQWWTLLSSFSVAREQRVRSPWQGPQLLPCAEGVLCSDSFDGYDTMKNLRT